MRSLWILVPLLGACDNGKEEPTPEDTGPVEEDAPPLAPPYLGFVMAIDQSASALKSTCEFALDLVDEGGQTVASAEGGGNGRQWIGLPLEENKIYTATAIWQNCTNYAEGQGMETSEAFSGAPGDLLAFHYDSLDTQFDTLHQAEDFEGGVVEAEFFEGVDPTSLVASLPSVTVENTGGTMWRFTWEDTVSPVQVLSELSTTRDFLGGSPVWVEEPPIWW